MARTVASIVWIVIRRLRRVTGMMKIVTWMVSIIRMVVRIVNVVLSKAGWFTGFIWYSYLFYDSFGSAYIHSVKNR
jgi:hypothetical protein